MGAIMSTKTMNETIKSLKVANQANRVNTIQQTYYATGINTDNMKIIDDLNEQTRSRASDKKVSLSATTRKKNIESTMRALLFSQISQGEALTNLRLNILGLKQSDYAKLVKVSRKTISDIENNKGNPSIEVLNKVFKPFALKVGLTPISASTLRNILA